MSSPKFPNYFSIGGPTGNWGQSWSLYPYVFAPEVKMNFAVHGSPVPSPAQGDSSTGESWLILFPHVEGIAKAVVSSISCKFFSKVHQESKRCLMTSPSLIRTDFLRDWGWHRKTLLNFLPFSISPHTFNRCCSSITHRIFDPTSSPNKRTFYNAPSVCRLGHKLLLNRHCRHRRGR
jgi:hypothetical protein